MDKKIIARHQEDSCYKTQANNSAKRTSKIELCLIELLERGESGLIALEALEAYGDTCLHSTISTLSNDHGLTFKRSRHRHKSERGHTTIFVRYSLANDEQVKKAQTLLKHYRAMRGIVALEDV